MLTVTPDGIQAKRLGNSSMVELRTLTPSILVRIQVPQPATQSHEINALDAQAALGSRLFVAFCVCNAIPWISGLFNAFRRIRATWDAT